MLSLSDLTCQVVLPKATKILWYGLKLPINTISWCSGERFFLEAF